MCLKLFNMNAACIIGLQHLKHCYQVKQPMALHQRLTIRVCLFGGEKGEEGSWGGGRRKSTHCLCLVGLKGEGGDFGGPRIFHLGPLFLFTPNRREKSRENVIGQFSSIDMCFSLMRAW
jgi:hypothetical protein